jgi:hypothetical protein
MDDSAIQNPGLRFGNDGAMYWKGRALACEDMSEVLDSFRDFVALHLMAWWERSHLPEHRDVLPQSGVLWKMAGLAPLRKPLDFFRSHLDTEDFFADRMESMPEPPKPLPQPKMRFRFSPETQAGELERRTASLRNLKAWVAYEKRQSEIEQFEKDTLTFPERLAKARRYPAWKREMRKLEAAYALLETWEAKLEEAKRLPGWDFLPPGPGLSFSPQWLRSFLKYSNPDATYDFDRIREIQSLDPIAIRRGSVGSVAGYLAFVFPGDRVALESPRVGNALYFFRADWQHLCLLPKAELRGMMAHGDPRIERFEHTPGRSLRDWLRGHLRSG